MTRGMLLTLITSAAALSLLTGGCCQKEKNHIVTLTRELNDVHDKLQQTQADLAACKARAADLASGAGGKEAEIARLNEQIDQLEAELVAKPTEVVVEKTVETAAGWEATTVGDKVTLGADILFGAGKSALTRAGKKKLDGVIDDLKTTYADLPIRIYGYTDSDPIRKTKHLYDDNLDLSSERSMEVTRYLRTRGIADKRIETIAMGETHPVAPNTSKANKAKNRRVEIFVIK